jgi:ACT domain-containing protein
VISGSAFANQDKVNIVKEEIGAFETLNGQYMAIEKSPQGLNDYKQKVIKVQRRGEKAGIKTFFSTISLNSPVSAREALDITHTYNLKTKLIYVFAESLDERTITIGLRLEKVNSVEKLEQAFQKIEKDEMSVVGVVSLIGVVPKNNLRKLQGDPRVFLVDVSADKQLSDNQNGKSYMHHLSWDIYHNR